MVLTRFLIFVVASLLAGGALAERVTVFAAASLREALEEAVATSGVDAVVSYGGSGALARQIAYGAPADIVILANEFWMDWLSAQGLLAGKEVSELAGNRLVLIGPPGAEALDLTVGSAPGADMLRERLQSGRMAVGAVETVPAGIYAKQWMQSAGLWSDLQAHLAETDSVRAALALVNRDEAPLGVVYASDAHAAPHLPVLYDIPAQMHARISYPIAVLHEGGSQRALFDFLCSPEAQHILAKHGFLPPGDHR